MSDPVEREAGIAAAALAVQRGQLIVLPTDTVYGVGADAFSPEAVQKLLDAKGRGRQMPPPVLVSAATTLDALTVGVPAYARALVAELWPGALTLVCRQQPSLDWDLGDNRSTVAVRMPDDEVALELLARTGPLAVSSANRTSLRAATEADQAVAMLGQSVAVVLDDGERPAAGAGSSAQPSSIVDVTDANEGRLLRAGGVPLERLNEVAGTLGAAVVDED